MTGDRLSFLDEPGMPDETAPEPVVEQVAEQPAPSQPRDEHGRFAAPAQVETGEPTPDAPPASAQKPEHTAPIAAVTAEREKRQAAERQVAEFQRRLAELEARTQPVQQQPQTEQPQFQMPDPVQDPEGYMRAIEYRQAVRLDDHEAKLSERSARSEFGNEAVEAALAAAQAAGNVQQFTTGFDRWQRLVKWHKQQQTLGEVGDDPAAYRERIVTETRQSLEAEIRAQILAEMKVQPAPSAPPPSIAAAPGAGLRSQPVEDDATAFSNAFVRRR